MKLTKVHLSNFKFFTDLTIEDISKEAEIVLLVGPNGTGKSCIFDAFNHFAFRSKRNGEAGDDEYYRKDAEKPVSVELFGEDEAVIERPHFGKRSANFYGRSSYRFTSKISRDSISANVATRVTHDQDAPTTYAELDQRIENDIEKALGELIQGVQAQVGKTDREIVHQVVGSLNDSLIKVFPESGLKLNRIIDPHSNPSTSKIDLEFSKNGTDFSFRNLSAGEKEVVDIIFNFHRRKSEWIKDGIFFIDEPELHLNTKIQALLLHELYRLCKNENAQLWVATHSLGFLRAAQDIKRGKPNSVSVVEFQTGYGDVKATIKPIAGTREDWKRIFQTALEDLTGLLAPRVLIYCEGKLRNSLDETLFNTIFSDADDCLFVSATSKSGALKYAAVGLVILNKAFDGIDLRVLLDRDEETDPIPKGAPKTTISKLERREIENYLCDYEIFSRAYPGVTKENYDRVINDIINDDVKSKTNDLIKLTGEKIIEKDLRLKLAENVTRDTQVYKDLARIIFD